MSTMTMSAAVTPTNTMADMSMPSQTVSLDSSHMTNMMGMQSMAMTFFSSTSTPLFSLTWSPKSTGAYAGTCVFLIALAAIFRALLSLRLNLFKFVGTSELTREQIHKWDAKRPPAIRTWRAKNAVWSASIDVLITGLAYLLYATAGDLQEFALGMR